MRVVLFTPWPPGGGVEEDEGMVVGENVKVRVLMPAPGLVLVAKVRVVKVVGIVKVVEMVRGDEDVVMIG
jgi:hypothetical protein